MESGIQRTRHEVEEGVLKVAREAEDELKSAADEIEETFTEELPEMLEEEMKKVIATLAEAVTKEGLRKIRTVVHSTHAKLSELSESKPNLVSEIDKLSGYIEIGPIKLNYSGFYARAGQISSVLDTYINNPPKFRRKPILDMVLALGPTSVNMGLSIQVVALVVGSKELGVGGGIGDIRLALFAEIGDLILEKMGVPE